MAGAYVLGIDLGLNNVGWALLRLKTSPDGNVTDEAEAIERIGVYKFDSPLVEDQDATSGLKSRDRGRFRRARRTLRRRSVRRRELYRVLAEVGLLPGRYKERVAVLCDHGTPQNPKHPYALRQKGLEQRLEPYEFGRALCHLNQRRGYLSPRDLMLWGYAKTDERLDEALTDEDEKKNEEEKVGPILKEIKKVREEMQGFPTLGAYLADRLRHNQPVRKKTKRGGKDLPKEELQARAIRFDRFMIQDEFEQLWTSQARFHPLLTDELKHRIANILFRQGMIGAQLGLRGKCVFFPDEPRLAKASLVAQRFTIAQTVAHLMLIDEATGERRSLNGDERQAVVDQLMTGDDLTWDQVRDIIGVPHARFDDEPESKKRKTGKKPDLKGAKTPAVIRKVIGDKWFALTEIDRNNLVGEIVTVPQGREQLSPAKRKLDLFSTKTYSGGITFTPTEAANLATLELPKGYLSVSRKLVRKVIRHLLNDKVYSDALKEIGLDHALAVTEEQKVDKLTRELLENVRHPLVRCSVLRAMEVVNAVRAQYDVRRIHVELPRDLAAGQEQREETERIQRENEKLRNELRAELLEAGLPATEINVKKLRLYKEAGGQLPYEPSHRVSGIKEVIDQLEIDHIIPRSHNFDNSLGNLALCTRDFNQRKGDRLLCEVVREQGGEAAWQEVKRHIEKLKSLPRGKRQRLLAEQLPEKDFTGRHLSATGYIGREVLRVLKLLRGVEDVIVSNGTATADLRRRWQLGGLIELHPLEEEAYRAWHAYLDDGTLVEGKPPREPSKNRSNLKHHALDALVVALASRSALLRVTKYYQIDEAVRKQKELRLPHPIEDLRAQARAAVDAAVIVHRPNRGVGGALHKQMPERPSPDIPMGKPNERRVIGKHLVVFDAEGAPAQAYPLESNHHLVIWESLTGNKKGVHERYAEVVTTIEAARRLKEGEPLFQTSGRPGYRCVMTLCKGDMVEMADGRVGVVSKFSAESAPGAAEIAIWRPETAQQLGGLKPDNPYLIGRLRGRGGLLQINAKVTKEVLGTVIEREGNLKM